MAEKRDMRRIYQALLAVANDPERFNGRCGVLVTDVGAGWAKGEIENGPLTQSVLGGIHGGALATLADTVAAVAVASLGGASVTVHSTLEYLKWAKPGPVTCEAKVRKAGKSISVCEVSLRDSGGEEIAFGIFSFHMTGEALLF